MKYVKLILINLGYFLSTFILLVITTNILAISIGGGVEYKYSEKLLPIALTLTISLYLYKDKLEFIKKLILLAVLYSSIFLLLILTHTQALFKNTVQTVGLDFSIAVFLLSVATLLKHFRYRTLILYLLAMLTAVPSIIFWLYYSIYKTLFTTDSLIAIMQTNGSESLEFIHNYVTPYTIIILLVSFIIFFIITKKLIILKSQRNLFIISIITIILSIISGYSCFNNILTGPIVDFHLLQTKYGNTIKYKEERLASIKQNLTQLDNSPGIYILVIGESHNKLYNSVYNYKVNSTPWLKDMQKNSNFIMFNDAYSNYPQTVQALTYALTLKNQYNSISLDKAPSLIEIANEAGYKTIWLSNQGKFSIWDTGVSLIANESTQSEWVNDSELRTHSSGKNTNYDGSLLPILKNLPLSNKMLIIIHLYGSHSTYEDRYPKEFDKFHGLENKNVDDYVNSIYYNDYLMKQIVDYAKTMPNFKGLLYFSDHSESVNHGGHNATNYRPDMVCIPMYMYFSDSYIKEYPKEFESLKKAQDYTFTNDLITNTMLSIMHIKLKNYYEPDNDLANPEYNNDFTRFRTLYGRAPLTDWHTLKPE